MPIIPANNIEIKDEGVSKGFIRAINFTGTGVTATVSDSIAIVDITGGSAGEETFNALAPIGDVTIPANYSLIVPSIFTLALGKTLTLGLGSIFRIL